MEHGLVLPWAFNRTRLHTFKETFLLSLNFKLTSRFQTAQHTTMLNFVMEMQVVTHGIHVKSMVNSKCT